MTFTDASIDDVDGNPDVGDAFWYVWFDEYMGIRASLLKRQDIGFDHIDELVLLKEEMPGYRDEIDDIETRKEYKEWVGKMVSYSNYIANEEGGNPNLPASHDDGASLEGFLDDLAFHVVNTTELAADDIVVDDRIPDEAWEAEWEHEHKVGIPGDDRDTNLPPITIEIEL